MIKAVSTVEQHKFHFRLDGVKGNKPTAVHVCLSRSKLNGDDNTLFTGYMELHDGWQTFQKISLEIKVGSLSKLEPRVKRAVDDFVNEYFESKGNGAISDLKYEL